MTTTNTRRPAASVAAALLAVSLPFAAVTAARATPPVVPEVGPAKPLVLPKIVERTLPNGLRLVILEDRRQPAVWMRLAVPAGSIRDPKDKIGLASMTAGLLNKGTATRTQEQIAQTVDSLGANLGASTDDDFLVVSANCLTPYAATLADLMADITLRPAFAQPEIDRVKTQTLSGIQSALGQPATLADAAAARLVYGAHPYGNFSAGSPATVQSITREDLTRFHGAHFAPNAGTLFIIGDISPDQAEALAKKAFGDWAKKDVPPAPAPPTPPAASPNGKPRVTIIDRPGSAQTEIRIGALTAGYASPDRIPGAVATAVLGLGQFEGRLTQEIRVKRGLTYGAGSGFDRKQQAGGFGISTFTKNATTGEVVGIALGELNKLRDVPPPRTELGERRTFLTGSFSVGVADPNELAQRLQTYTLLGGGPGELERYVSRVEATTPEQVRQILRGIPLDRAQVVLVGDAKEIRAQVADLGPVTVIPADELDLSSPTLRGAAVPTAAAAQTAASPEQAAAGRALLDAAIAAHGGAAFLAVKSIKATGSGELSPPGTGASLPIDSLTLTTSGEKARLDLTSALVGTITIASSGARAGWVSFGGNIQDQATGGIVGDPTAVLRDAKTKNLAVSALPADAKPVTVDGKTLKGFTVTSASTGQPASIYLDPQTNLVRRITSGQGAMGATIELGEYQTAEGGVKLPGTITANANGARVFSLKLTGFTVNAPVDATIFEKPKS